MHIAIVTNRLIVGEGQGRVNVELARAAARAGHVVTCLAHRVDNELLMEPNVEWVSLPDANAPVALIGNQRFAWASTSWLKQYGETVDLVVGNGFNTWAPTDINIVHFVHGAWRTSPVHDARLRRDAYGAYQWLYSTLNARLEQIALRRARHVVAVSEKVREELLTIGVPASSMSVIHNGVDINEFRPGPKGRSAIGLPSGPLALFAGDIRTPRKGIDTVLQALQHVPELHLAVAGDLTNSPYPALAEDLGVSNRTHFLGFRRDVPQLMQAADFFVLPSRYEACSLVLLEAMSTGLPLVTARTAGGAELISEDAGIVLDNPNDVNALATALDRLVVETTRSEKMGRAARQIAEHHSWEHMAHRYLELFDHLISQKSIAHPPMPDRASLPV